MPGTKRVLNLRFNNPALPILPSVDPIETVGSLLLIDWTHPSYGGVVGVPGNGGKIANVLVERAKTLTGTSDSTVLGAKVYKTGGSTLSQSDALLERTSKGGLHAAISPTSSTASTLGWTAYLDTAVLTYLRANLSHVFYVSLWHRITRAATPDSGFRTIFGGPNGYARFRSDSTIAYDTAGVGITGSSRPAVNTVGPVLRNASSVTGFTGTLATPTQEQSLFAGQNGGLSANLSSTSVINRNASHIFYRTYVEDLTVSGRSYGAVDALDYALFTKEVLTSGGRYYGDTFTNPATLT